jgi:ribosomal protein S6
MTKRTEEHQDVKDTLYEIGYLIVPTIAQEQLPGVVQEIKSILDSNQATVTSEGEPSLTELAYDINKSSKAYFGWIRFNSLPEVAPQIKKKLDEMKSLLRFLLIKADESTVIIKDEPEIEEAVVEADVEVIPTDTAVI